MARMVVTREKPVRYPVSGPDGKEYKKGEEFDTLSDRDAETFRKIGAARLASNAPAVKPAGLFTQQMRVEAPADPMQTQDALQQPANGRYSRRDLRAKE